MPDQRLEKAFRRLRIGVVVASAVLSGLCGLLAGGIHGERFVRGFDPHQVTDWYVVAAGVIFGVLAGIGAGLLWSRALKWATLKSIERSGRVSPLLVFYGLGMGFLAGIAATVVLHAALTLLTLQGDHIFLALIAQIFGVPAGLGLGLICGFVWWLVCRAALRKQAGDGEAAAQ
ncbi:MAG: hypothetical protein NT049_01780 [Planctomycetota bacterium]|nr:hypothetical protein [Planctomycetota bacterium]